MMIGLIYDLIFILPLSVASSLIGYPLFGDGVATVYLYAAASAASVFCILLYHLKTRGKIILCGIAGTAVAGIAIIGKAELLYANKWILWVMITAAVCFGAGKLANRYLKLKIAIAAAGTVMLILMMIFGYRDAKGIFVMTVFYMLMTVVETIQVLWKKEGDTDKAGHVVFMMPFVMTVIVLISVIKPPKDPYDWRFFKDLIRNVRSGYEIAVQTLFPESGWDGSDTMGFSDRAVIGGRVQGDPYTVLEVSSDVKNDYRLYLGGKTFDTFDGRKWKKTDTSDIDQMSYDLLETLSAVRLLDSEQTEGYLKKVRIRIKYEGIRTKHLFVPLKSIPEVQAFEMEQKGADLTAKRSRRADYAVKYYRINRDDQMFRDMLCSDEQPTDGDRQAVLQGYEEFSNFAYSAEGYDRYHTLIYENYMKPVQMTERTRQLVDDCLQGAESDMEKLERIEKLLSGMTYSRNPGEIPDEVVSEGDYLDYLLFEKKEGFCTHFATAFVLLARSQNIPARYVQGYSALSRVTGFEIGSDRTHAWPEAYISGKGWIVFEPTPGYRQKMGWDKITGKESETAGGTVHSVYKDAPDPQESDDTAVDPEETESSPFPDPVWIRWILTMLLTASVFLILFFTGDYFYRKYRYDHLDDKDKILTLCKKNMKMLGRTGCRIRGGETLAEFAIRVKENVPEEIMSFVDVYERILYSGRDVHPGEVAAMEQCSRSCRDHTVAVIVRRFNVFEKFRKKT